MTLEFARNSFLALSLPLLLSACSIKDAAPTGKPTTPEEAIRALPDESRSQLQAWMNSIEKDCSATDALAQTQNTMRASQIATPTSTAGLVPGAKLDVKALLARNAGSFAFVEGNSRFALLTEPEYPTASGNNRFEFSMTVNGQEEASIKAEAKFDGQHCRLYIQDQLVFETVLAERFSIAAAFDDKRFRERDSSTAPTRPSLDPTSTSSSSTSLSGHGLVEALNLGLKPEQEAVALIARKLGLSALTAERYFRLRGTVLNNDSIQVMNRPGLLPFSSFEQRLIGSRNELSSFMTDRNALTLRLRLAPLRVPGSDSTLLGDHGNWALEVQLKPEQVGRNERRYRVETARWQGVEAFNDKEALECLNARLNPLRELEAPTSYELNPSWDALSTPCMALSENLVAATYRDQRTLASLRSLLRSARPDATFSYNGWQNVIKAWIAFAIQDGSDLRTRLDPRNEAPVLRAAADLTQALLRKTDRYENLKTYRERLSSLGVSWALNGAHATDAQQELILQAAQNLIDVSPSAVWRLLDSLQSSPYEHDDALKYAVQLTPADKDTLRQVELAAQEIEMSSWASKRLGSLLQERPAAATVATWLRSLQAAKGFSERDWKRARPEYEAIHKQRKQKLLERALSEGWLEEDFQAAEIIAPVARASSFCQHYTDVSQLIDCQGGDAYSRQAGLLLDPAFANRYADLARELAPRLNSLARQTSLFDITSNVIRSVFAPLWGRCSNEMFLARGEDLVRNLDQLLTTSDFSAQRTLGRVIDQKLRASCN